MQGNNGKGNKENRDDWETPNEMFENLNKQYKFNFDCCASEQNHKLKNWTNDFTNLTYIDRVCWMNPPFSKAGEMFEHFFKSVSRGIAIYRCDNFETRIWQDIIFKNCSWILIPKGRVTYQYNKDIRNGKGCRFPSALIGFNVPIPKHIKGTILGV